MGAKEDLLQDLSRGDTSGGIIRLHEMLIMAGLKYKGPRNSKTLLYYFLYDGREVGVAAMRSSQLLSVLSLPAAFWEPRPGLLSSAHRRAGSFYVQPVGPVSSSQYSAAQFQITSGSIDTLLLITQEIIIPEARAACV